MSAEVKTLSIAFVPHGASFARFFEVYRKHHAANGGWWDDRMWDALAGDWREGKGTKDGPSCKAACAELGIRHTYRAIYAYMAGWERSTWAR